MDIAKVVHFCYAAEVRRLHLFDRRKDRHHGIVDPDVYRSEALFERCGGCLYCLIVAYISCIGSRGSAQLLDFRGGCVESRSIPRNQTNSCSRLSELVGNGSAKSRRCSCNDNCRRLSHLCGQSFPGKLEASKCKQTSI